MQRKGHLCIVPTKFIYLFNNIYILITKGSKRDTGTSFSLWRFSFSFFLK